LGSPICKLFAAWRGITVYDGLATYDDTYSYNQYGFWKGYLHEPNRPSDAPIPVQTATGTLDIIELSKMINAPIGERIS
jgi:hypothetical protein